MIHHDNDNHKDNHNNINNSQIPTSSIPSSSSSTSLLISKIDQLAQKVLKYGSWSSHPNYYFNKENLNDDETKIKNNYDHITTMDYNNNTININNDRYPFLFMLEYVLGITSTPPQLSITTTVPQQQPKNKKLYYQSISRLIIHVYSNGNDKDDCCYCHSSTPSSSSFSNQDYNSDLLLPPKSSFLPSNDLPSFRVTKIVLKLMEKDFDDDDDDDDVNNKDEDDDDDEMEMKIKMKNGDNKFMKRLLYYSSSTSFSSSSLSSLDINNNNNTKMDECIFTPPLSRLPPATTAPADDACNSSTKIILPPKSRRRKDKTNTHPKNTTETIPIIKSIFNRYKSLSSCKCFIHSTTKQLKTTTTTTTTTIPPSAPSSSSLTNQQSKERLQKHINDQKNLQTVEDDYNLHCQELEHLTKILYIHSSRTQRIIFRQELGYLLVSFVRCSSLGSNGIKSGRIGSYGYGGGGGSGSGISEEDTSAEGINSILRILLLILRGMNYYTDNNNNNDIDMNNSQESSTSTSSSSIESLQQLLYDILIPLHKPSGMVLWRDQLPLIGLYHKHLVECIATIIQILTKDDNNTEDENKDMIMNADDTKNGINDNSINKNKNKNKIKRTVLIKDVILALLRPEIWPTTTTSSSSGGIMNNNNNNNGSTNTPKVVLLLHEIDTILSLLPSQNNCDKDGTTTTTTNATTILPIMIDKNNNQALTIMITTLIGTISNCIQSDNSTVSNRALEIFRNDKFCWLIQSRLLLLSNNNNNKMSLPKGQNIEEQVQTNDSNNNNNNNNFNIEGRIIMKMLIRALCRTTSSSSSSSSSSLSMMEPPWNPTVRKRTAIVLKDLYNLNSILFQDCCEEIFGFGGGKQSFDNNNSNSRRCDNDSCLPTNKLTTTTTTTSTNSTKINQSSFTNNNNQQQQHLQQQQHDPPPYIPSTLSRMVRRRTTTEKEDDTIGNNATNSNNNNRMTMSKQIRMGVTGVAPWAINNNTNNNNNNSNIQMNKMLPLPVTQKEKGNSIIDEREGKGGVVVEASRSSSTTSSYVGMKAPWSSSSSKQIIIENSKDKKMTLNNTNIVSNITGTTTMMIDNGDGDSNGASNENVNNTRDSINDDEDMSKEEGTNQMDIINDENFQTKNYSHQSSSSIIAIIGPGLAKVIAYLQLLDPSSSSSTNPFDDNSGGSNSSSSSSGKSNSNHDNSDEKHCWEKEALLYHPTLLPTLRFHDLVFGSELGKGAFGIVKYARRIIRNESRSKWPEYAVKVVSTQKIVEMGYEASINREITVLRTMTHPGVARLISSFRFRDGAYLVLEYASGGDLYDLLKTNGSLDKNSTRFVIGEVIAALASIHGCGFVYGDLKPENILIMGSGHVKLTDFGACRPVTVEAKSILDMAAKNILRGLRDGDWRESTKVTMTKEKRANDTWIGNKRHGDGSDNKLHELGKEESGDSIDDNRLEGTTAYLPPEVVLGGIPTISADSWALGCVLFQCLSGRPPILEDDDSHMRRKIVSFVEPSIKGRSFLGLDDPKATLCNESRLLISNLLRREALLRPTMIQVSEESFFEGIDIFKLYRGLAPQLNVGRVSPAADSKWARRQLSCIWAPQPQAYEISGKPLDRRKGSTSAFDSEDAPIIECGEKGSFFLTETKEYSLNRISEL